MAEIVIRLDLRLDALKFRPSKWMLTGAMLLAVVPELASESVTLTTYYPAPSGVYTTMITTNNTYLARDGGSVGIGTAAPGQTLDIRGNVVQPNYGSIYYMPEISGTSSYQGFAANGNGMMSDGVPWYFGVGREPGGWVYPYPDLVVNNHTGVRLAAHSNYGGISIYEQLNPAGTAWSSAGTEIAQFKDQRYGGTHIDSYLNVGSNANASQALTVAGNTSIAGTQYDLKGSGSANSFVSAAALNTSCYFTAYGAGPSITICAAGYYATMNSGYMSKYLVMNDAVNPAGDVLCCQCPTIANWPWGVANGCPNM